MQRRAAAAYATLFIVLAVGAYLMIGLVPESVAGATERINGLWGVTLLSGLAAIILLGGSYLPSRY